MGINFTINYFFCFYSFFNKILEKTFFLKIWSNMFFPRQLTPLFRPPPLGTKFSYYAMLALYMSPYTL